MRWLVCLLGIALVVQTAAAAETIFDKRKQAGSIQAYRRSLEAVRVKLYDRDNSTRRRTISLLDDSLDDLPTEDDADFPLQLLGDIASGGNVPDGGTVDPDTQQRAERLLIKSARDDDFPYSRRETALAQLRRVVVAKVPQDKYVREGAFEVIVQLSRDDNPLLAHGAWNALAHVVGNPAKEWELKREEATLRLRKPLGNDDLEPKRAAILEVAEALRLTQKITSSANRLWDELTDEIGDADSPALVQDLRPALLRLTDSRQGKPYASEAAKLKRALNEYGEKVKPSRESYDDLFEHLVSGRDREDEESMILRIERDPEQDGALRERAAKAIAARLLKNDVRPAEVRLLSDAQLRLAQRDKSAVGFLRLADMLLQTTYQHRGDPGADVAVAQLARLLSTSAAPSLVNPVLDKIATLAERKEQPLWVARRLVFILFLQAGDSPSDAIRAHAMALLERVAKDAPSWAVRLEVWNRMTLLAAHAHDTDVLARARSWLEG